MSSTRRGAAASRREKEAFGGRGFPTQPRWRVQQAPQEGARPSVSPSQARRAGGGCSPTSWSGKVRTVVRWRTDGMTAGRRTSGPFAACDVRGARPKPCPTSRQVAKAKARADTPQPKVIFTCLGVLWLADTCSWKVRPLLKRPDAVIVSLPLRAASVGCRTSWNLSAAPT